MISPSATNQRPALRGRPQPAQRSTDPPPDVPKTCSGILPLLPNSSEPTVDQQPLPGVPELHGGRPPSPGGLGFHSSRDKFSRRRRRAPGLPRLKQLAPDVSSGHHLGSPTSA
ncbi:hypothetical protein MLD38_038054 [Melastoma candidum]|uniref:Uncharacterized protein n=1 Tax=Melastoma candidum TaxID=119954 RepID=A0ACB9KYP1_9MYRT|nr:hypothetical protein MLD38_038054 [Melastoma candidum]